MKADHPEFNGDEKASGFFVVGIGASAGGIQALKEFFQHLPANTDIAYVVILHLSPDHDSKLAEIISTVASIPVLQVIQKTKIEPNNIYVVPPNKHLVISDGFIAPIENLHTEDRRAPVDIFFRNLADNFGPRAVSVVLSGTGANGSMGLKRIKERGGVVYVQSPREAEFNEMPRNAIATELVDEILPVAEIPSRILAYRDNQGTVSITDESDLRPEQQKQALREIFAELRRRTGNDFSNYKRATLLRRIERRINIRNLADLPSYVSYLHQNPEESQALLKDLLISVTNFFRDLKTFEALEREVIPLLFKDKKSGDEVRIWIAGCATGEEAYSIAILCSENVLEMADPPKVQIFATDIDDAAIASAREGLYSLNDVADVSPDRLRMFFTRDGEYYRVRKEIREMIIFATHNFLKDPPFSRLDLISCRNVMIYLNSTAQERVAETFHFAIKPNEFLFLGTSETVDGANDLFSPFDRENHIYQAREITVRSYPVPSSVPNFQFSKNDPLQKTDEKDIRPIRTSFGELHQRLLEQYAPPSIVVNEEYDIVHLSDKAGKYLELKGGELSQNLLKLIRPELRLELRSSLYQAVQNKSAVKSNLVPLFLDGQKISVEVQARPVLEEGNSAKGFILVLFIQHSIEKEDAETVLSIADEPVAKHLEEELMLMKTRLKNSIEQHEVQAEELKASNEELQAMNEELRSSAEELETSKEELQSINEELRTVNQELKVKIEETSLTSNNLQNLINSTNLGTIFLDRSFSIRLFTPAVLDLFNLKPGDFGRPTSDITHKLKYNNLLQDAEAVLANLLPVEKEVTSTDGKHFLMRLLPYRTNEDRINGVVITLIDITKRKKSEYALQQSEEYLRLIIESAKDYAIFTLDIERRIVRWSTGAQTMMGYSEEEIKGRSGDITFIPEDREKGDPLKEALKAEKEGRAENERWHLRKNRTKFWGSGSVSPLRDNDGNLMGFVKIMRDLTESKEAEELYRSRMEKEVSLRTSELRETQQQYASLVENTPDIITRWNKETALIFANSAFEKLSGKSNKEQLGKTAANIEQTKDIADTYSACIHAAFEKGKPIEHYHTFPSGSGIRKYYSRIVPEKNREGKVETVLAIARDITDLKEAEQEIIAIKEELAQKATDKYLMLFNSIDEGFFLAEVILDKENKPVDIHYIDANPASRRLIAIDFLNKHQHDINKDYEDHWLELFSKVILTGQSIRLEQYSAKDEKWFDFFVTKVGNENSRQVAVVFQDITELIRTRKELEQSRDLLQSVFDAAHNGLCVLSCIRNEQNEITDLKYLFANEAFKNLVPGEDVKGKLYSSIHPDFRNSKFYEIIRQVVKTGLPNKHQFVKQVGQQEKWYNITTIKLHDGVVISYEDISEIKKAENILRESEQRKTFLLKLSDAMNQLADPVQLQNEALKLLCEVLNTDRAFYAEIDQSKQKVIVVKEYVQNNLETIVGKYEVDKFLESFSGYNSSHNLLIADTRLINNNFPVDKQLLNDLNIRAIAAVPLIRQENLTGCYCIASKEPKNWTEWEINLLKETADRTFAAVEKAEAKIALNQSKERLQLIIESAKGFAIFTTTAEGIINSWNPGAAEIFGWEEEEIIGKNSEVLFTAEDREKDQPRIEMEMAIQDGIAPDIRWHLHRNGSLVYINGFVHPFYEGGKLDGFVKIGRDMTQHHEAEKAFRKSEEKYRARLEKEVEQRTIELKEINNNLRYANENLQQFASIASHDLQEPLRKIKIFTSILNKKWSHLVTEEGRAIIQKITYASDRMGQLIQEVLEYSRIAYGAKEYEKTDLSLALQNVLGDLDLLTEETGARIHFPEKMPTIDAIPLQMHQLFYNLINNALKFKRLNIPPEIKISIQQVEEADIKNYKNLKEDKSYLEIIVADNGIGFDPQFSEQIFQIFERLHTTDEYEGTGVGLALCKKIVENHHGHIFAISNIGEGSTFHIIIPVKQ